MRSSFEGWVERIAVGLGLVNSRVGQEVGHLPDHAGQVGARLSDPEYRADRARPDVGRKLLRGSLASVLAQSVRDLVAHHPSDLIVRQLELLEDTGVERDLAAGHAPGVDFGRSENVD